MDSMTNKLKHLTINYSICNLCRKKFNKSHNTNFCHNCSKLVSYHLEKMKT
jgi:hypothetical protein